MIVDVLSLFQFTEGCGYLSFGKLVGLVNFALWFGIVGCADGPQTGPKVVKESMIIGEHPLGQSWPFLVLLFSLSFWIHKEIYVMILLFTGT